MNEDLVALCRGRCHLKDMLGPPPPHLDLRCYESLGALKAQSPSHSSPHRYTEEQAACIRPNTASKPDQLASRNALHVGSDFLEK